MILGSGNQAFARGGHLGGNRGQRQPASRILWFLVTAG